MAGQRIDIMELRQLIQLKRKGLSNRKVAKALGMSRNTVNAYVQIFTERGLDFAELEKLSEAKLAELFPSPDSRDQDRYQELAGYFPGFANELQKTGCTLQALWKSYLDEHPGGYRYTQFVHYFNQWSHKNKASGILRHKAGEKLFIDFAGKTLEYVDRQTGQIHPAQVFVAILPASQYTYVQAVDTQKREDLVWCITECLRWLGGVPKALVSDNMKAVVARGHKYAPLINKTLKDLALHYACVIDPTRPYHPRDKALVEGAVHLVYQRIYYPLSGRSFFSLGELNEAIRELLVPYNDYRFRNREGTRRTQFLGIEQAALAPLPQTPYQMRYYKRAKVQKISHIYLGADKNYYSVPHRFVGCRVQVQYTRSAVEIFYQGERIAAHRRSYTPGHYTTVSEHLPSTHQAYNDWNPDWFARRAAKIGPCTERYIQRLIGQYEYPELGYKQAQGILAFLGWYPPERLEAACKRADQGYRASYRSIEHILGNNLDQMDEPEPPLQDPIPEHENIRGGGHYQ